MTVTFQPRWLEDMPLPAGIIGVEGGWEWRNPAWLDLDPIGGMPFVWPLEFFEHIGAAVRDRATSVMRSVSHRERNEVFDLWVGPVGETGEIDAAWVVAADVTLYEESAAADMVRRRMREASVFVQGILHETRNPLAGIQATVQLMLRRFERDRKTGKARESDRESLQQILSDIERINGVLQELTLLAGPLRLRRTRTNLHALIDEAIGTVTSMANRRNIEIRRVYDPSLPELDVDPDRLYRVYLNLLRNAVEASPEDGVVQVQTAAEPDRRSGRSAWVTRVLDEGPGFDDQIRTLLFTPLFTTKAEGTGLGLAISQQIVQAHGGLLRLSDRRRGEAHKNVRGAEAVVLLPLGHASLEAPAEVMEPQG